MGDKWTTSGRSRLKAKQNRSFAARGQPRAAAVRRRELEPPVTTTKQIHNKTAKAMNPLSHPVLRAQHNGGKQQLQTKRNEMTEYETNDAECLHHLLDFWSLKVHFFLHLHCLQCKSAVCLLNYSTSMVNGCWQRGCSVCHARCVS